MNSVALAALPGDGAQGRLIGVLEAGEIVSLAQVGWIWFHVRQHQLIDREALVDIGRKCFRPNFAAERQDQGDTAFAPTLADFVKAVLGRGSGIFPDPVFGITMALENINRHLVAQLAAEVNKQRDWGEREERNMTGFMHVHAWLVEPFYFLLNEAARLVDKSLSFGVDGCEIYQVSLGIDGISRRDGLRHLRCWNGDGLPGDSRLELHHRGLQIRAKAGNMKNTVFVCLLEFLQDRYGVVVGVIVDELVALRTHQHQVRDIIDIGGTQRRSARAPAHGKPRCGPSARNFPV